MASDIVARALAIKAGKILPSVSASDAGKLATVDSNGKWAAAELEVGQGEVAVDSTLLVSGAAADAKATGDKITDLKSAFDSFLDVQDEYVDKTVSYESDNLDFYKVGTEIYVRTDQSKWLKCYAINVGEPLKLKASASGDISYYYCFADGSLQSGRANIVNGSYTNVTDGSDVDLVAPSGASYICVTSNDGTTISVKNTRQTSGRLDGIENDIDGIKTDITALESNTNILLDDVAELKGKAEKNLLIVDTWAAFPFRKEATFSQDAPFTVSGSEGDSSVSIDSGTATLTSSDLLAAIVIEHDDGTFRPYVITAYTASTISIYPALHEDVTGKSLVPFLSNSQHLSANGFKAYMQYIDSVNPKHCDKRQYLARFCPMTSQEIASKNPFTRLSGSPQFYGSSRNDGLVLSTQRGPYVVDLIPYADYSTTGEYGVYWEVSTGDKSGFLETFVGTDYALFHSNGDHLEKDENYEMYIEVYADEVQIFSKTKTDNLVERICVDYTEEQDKIKLKVYYKKLRNQVDTLTIGETTFWVNGSCPTELLPKEATVSMLFDSWGAFFKSSTISQPADCWHSAKDWEQGASGEELKRIMAEKAGFVTPVFNTSYSGATSRWGRSWLGVAVKDHNPDIMLTDFGINDYHTTIASTFPDEVDPYGNTISMSTPLSQSEYASNMQYIFNSCLMSEITPVFIGGQVGSSILWIQYLVTACSTDVSSD